MAIEQEFKEGDIVIVTNAASGTNKNLPTNTVFRIYHVNSYDNNLVYNSHSMFMDSCIGSFVHKQDIKHYNPTFLEKIIYNLD